jgi:hypothetical protein
MAASLHCEKGKKEKDDAAKEQFRIPDSLLAPIEGYHLVRDDYHPIRGGIMASRTIELHYPASQIARFLAIKAFGYAKAGWEKVNSEIGRPTEGKLYIIGTKDLDEYKFLTHKEWWYYGYIAGDSIYFEPFDIMIKRTIAEMGITQKIAQMALRRASGGKVPVWMREAVASMIAEEREILWAQSEEFRLGGWEIDISPDEIERSLVEASDRRMTRLAYYAGYRMLENLLERSSMDNVMIFVRMLGTGSTLDEASQQVFGMNYSALLDSVRIDDRADDDAG